MLQAREVRLQAEDHSQPGWDHPAGRFFVGGLVCCENISISLILFANILLRVASDSGIVYL